MTDRQGGTCRWCGKPTAPGRRGPVPEYCSRGHRQRAYEARREVPDAGWLLDRAESYGRDAASFREAGDSAAAVIYETVRDELRKCAKLLMRTKP